MVDEDSGKSQLKTETKENGMDLGVLSKFRIFVTTFFTLTTCLTTPTYSQDLSTSGLYYKEGNKKISLEVEEGLLMEFEIRPGSSLSRSPLKNAQPGASLVREQGSGRLWKTSEKGLGSVAVAKSLNSSASGKFSPVFRQSGGAQLLALPGNIIVQLDPTFTDSEAEDFFAKQGLRIERKLEIGKNFFEIQTPSGVSSLNIANSISEKPGVLSSSPNWWREVVAK